MKKVMRFFRHLADSMHRWDVHRREAYLAGATDIYDLEHRQRLLERGNLRSP
ncbi:MAG: DUF3563 family protein [Betaproteobacteria bacterium]